METSAPTFNYDRLFASTIPAPAEMRTVDRAKYDFAIAYPDPASVPAADLAECARLAILEEGSELAVYPHDHGYPPLREYVAYKMARDRGFKIGADDVLLADGSSQPNHILIEALVDPGDVVLTEHFVYSGTLRTLARFQADVRGVPTDENGILPDALESAIVLAESHGRHPKLIYTIPTFQNPMGWTMSIERRKAIIDIALRHQIAIIEDDCYVDLRYDGESIPSMRSLDDAGIVSYVGSFSKITGPGMRLGYVIPPNELMPRLRPIKSGGGVNQFAAWAIHRYAISHLDEHVKKINDIQRMKRDTMLAALGENLGSVAKWSHPDGGLYTWLEMPAHADLTASQSEARAVEVGYQPGPMFAPDGRTGNNYARLCYGYNTPDEIREGITRLAEVFDRKGYLDA